MISFKDFIGCNLIEVKTKNVIGGNVIYSTEMPSDTGLYTKYDEYTDDGKYVKSWIEGPAVGPDGEK